MTLPQIDTLPEGDIVSVDSKPVHIFEVSTFDALWEMELEVAADPLNKDRLWSVMKKKCRGS